jgi:hypothetical protein
VVPVVLSAEELDAPDGHFSVAVIGNAFHRLPRDLVAGRVLGWLEPADWDQARRQRPDATVLTEAGFELVGRPEFLVEHRWTLPELAGFAR